MMAGIKGLLLICVAILPVQGIYSQDLSSGTSPDFEAIIESLFPGQEEDFDYTDIYDRLFSIYNDPIDLNSCTRDQLESVYLLNSIQVQSLLKYREQYGAFLSIYELRAIPDIEESTVEWLVFFVTVKGRAGETHFKRKFRPVDKHQFLMRYDQVFEQAAGYSDVDSVSRFLGNPSRLFGRYTLASQGDYHLGFTFEKDPGEQVSWRPKTAQYGMDYYAWHAMIEKRGILKKAIVGNYSLGFGQGLVCGVGLKMGKGLETVSTIKRRGMGVAPYRSVYEHRDFYGAAVTLGSNNFSITGYWSMIKRDALPEEDSMVNEEPYVTVIKKTGLHRNLRELQGKHRINEHSFGMNAEIRLLKRQLKLGVNTLETRYDYNLFPSPSLYNEYAFKGNLNRIGSVYGDFVWKYINVFGEAAISESGGTGAVAGLISSLTSYLQLSFLWRNYQRNFHTFYSKAFGENYKNSNENGYYFGLKISPDRKTQIGLFYDRFMFPWLRYGADAPSKGNELVALVSYKPSIALKFRAIYRQKKVEKSLLNEGSATSKLEEEIRQSLRIDLDWTLMPTVKLATRVQFSRYAFTENVSQGIILAQDFNYLHNGFRLTARCAYFNTANYDSRIFIYERDLPFVYNIPSFYGQGLRYYLIAGVEWNRHISSWLKISQTYYIDRSTIGSGLDEIVGNHKTRIKLQALFRF